MRYFVTHTTAKQLIEKYKSSIAGGNFSYNLMGAGIFDMTYSILPTNIYHYVEDLSIDDIHIVYSNVRNKSKLCRFIGCLIEQWKIFKFIKRGSSVWLYNLCVLNFFLFLLLRFFKRNTGVYIILADYSPGEGVNSFYLWLTNKADGLITLSNSSLFKVKNLKVLPGIVPSDSNYPQITKEIKRNFQLSGNLKEHISSTSKVMEAFSKLPQLRLNMSGRIPDGVDILQYSDKYDNIAYHGVMAYEDFVSMLDENSFVLSTRDPSYPENQCNFPSKILEGLLHNRIIISTIYYPQLDGLKYFQVPCDMEGMTRALEEIAGMDDDELLEYANQGDKVKEMFSPAVWKLSVENLESNDGN